MPTSEQAHPVIITTALEKLEEFKQLRQEWTKLWAQSGLSFFSSWEWSWTWWQIYREQLPKSAKLKIFVFREQNREEPLAILPAYEVRELFGLNHRLTLLGVGEPINATVYTEFLDLLCLSLNRKMRSELITIFKAYDHICCGILRKNSMISSVLNSAEFKDFDIKTVGLPTYKADLSQGFKHYLSTLSSNTRNQAKRILKQIDVKNIQLSVANTSEEQTDWFNRLKDLHQREWQQRGKPGAFENPLINNFHSLLFSLAPQIRLFRLGQQGNDIGYIYGFMSPERFEWYQMGINSEIKDLIARPGYALHLSIIRSLTNANETGLYDFLGGYNQLKEQLGPLKEDANHVNVFKRTIRYRIKSIISNTLRRIITLQKFIQRVFNKLLNY